MFSLYVSKLELMQSLIQFLRHDMNVSLNTMLYSPHCSPIFPSVFGRGESTMCNKLLLQFGGCTTHFGSFCVYSSVYVLGSLLLLWKVENHRSRKKKSILLCGSSVKTPVFSVTSVHEVAGSSCFGHIPCSVTADCQ